jgi:hypothetical protein
VATKKKETPEVEVRNMVVLEWVDDDGEIQQYEKRLRRPKGRQARLTLPRIFAFLGKIADMAQTEETDSFSDQTKMMSEFFTQENEELFPIILQLETDEELEILEEKMAAIDVINAVTRAAEYTMSESLQRPEVQQALKKSDGDEPKEDPS